MIFLDSICKTCTNKFEDIDMITTTSLKLCNHQLRNIVIVSHDENVVSHIKHKCANVHNMECFDVIKNSKYKYGNMWIDGMKTFRTQYDLFVSPFKFNKLKNNGYIGFTYSLRGCSFDETNNLSKRFVQEVSIYGYSLTHDVTMKNNEHKCGNQMYTSFYHVHLINNYNN